MKLNFLRSGIKLSGLVAGLFFAFVSQAQVWSENFNDFDGFFQDGQNSTGWSMYDVDGQTPATNVADFTQGWNWQDAWDATQDGIMVSNSWYDPFGQADKWLGTPAIAIPNTDGLQFKWQVKSQDVDFLEAYQVVVSTAGNTLANLQAGTVVYSETASPNDWTSRAISLDAYKGQTIYIGFHNISNDKFLLLLDNLSVDAPTEFELALSGSVMPIEYAEYPLDQNPSWGGFAITVGNTGAQGQTNVTFSTVITAFDIDGNPVEVFNQSTSADIASTGSQNLSITETYAPTAVGLHAIEYFVYSDQQDTLAADLAFANITDGAYGRAAYFYNSLQDADGNPLIGDFSTQFLSFDDDQGNDGAGAIGYVFEVVNETTVDSLSALLGSEAQGDITLSLYSINTDGSLGNEIATTVPYTATGGQDNGEFLNAPLQCPVSLAAGAYAVVIHDEIGNDCAIVCSNYFYTNGAIIAHLGDENWFSVSAGTFVPWIFVSTTTEAIGVADNVEIEAANDGLQADFNAIISGGALCDLTWNFGDGGSATGTSVSHTYANGGTYTVTVSGSYGGGTPVTDTYEITVGCSLAASVNATATTATAVVTGGTPATYQWQTVGGQTLGTNANITGLSENTAYVLTVTDVSGCEALATFTTSTCAFTINSVVLDGSTAGAFASNFSNGTAPYQYQWTNAAGSVVSASNSASNLVSAQIYTLTVTDASGCSDSFNFEVPASGIEDLNGVVSFQMTPNPTSSDVQLSLQLNKTENISIEIYNISGQKVVQLPNVVTNAIQERLDLSYLPSGTYTVKVNVGNQSAAATLMLVK
ncbi:MAG: choice-of-anchor J domain-containing protein [Sphingobacteriales bacterium]|nr:choice-of-anchor J domain-containing protein [Sphingobacteriales bacterium]